MAERKRSTVRAQPPGADPPQDVAKVDAAVLALLHLNSWTERLGPFAATSAWKSLNWDALDRLHAAGLISDPRTNAKSVVLSEEGARRAAEACARLFGTSTAEGGCCGGVLTE